tara:strand:- start:114 stop:344 length:231 start_codon:yes stop_codon:yes gene_type:complete
MKITLTHSQVMTITQCLKRIHADNKFDIETSLNFRPEDVVQVKLMKGENLKIERILDKMFEEQHKGFKFTKHQEEN